MSVADAKVELDLIARQLALRYPASNQHRGVDLVAYSDLLVSGVKPSLGILSGAAALVLVVACLNVVGLILMRGSERRQEYAIRRALGASHRDVIQHVAVESLLLSLAAGAVALIVSTWSIRAIASLLAGQLPEHVQPGVDWRTLGFAIAVSIAVAVAFSVLPSVAASRRQPSQVLKTGARGATTVAATLRMRSGLVVAELACTVALLVTAGLMLQSVYNLATADRGFELANRLTFQLRLADGTYENPQRITGFYDKVLARIRALPGVETAAASSFLPASDLSAGTVYEVRGRESHPDEELQVAYWVVTDDFFEAMGLPLRSGRVFASADGPDAPRTALVSRALAERVWPEGGCEGAQIRMRMDVEAAPWHEGTTNEWLTVVGVADDYHSFNGTEQRMEPGQAIYVPLSQHPRRMMHLIVHADGPSSVQLRLIRDAIAQVDPGQPITFVRPYEDVVFGAFKPRQTLSLLLSAFAFMGVLLAVVGTYGLVSHHVSLRGREFALRQALGADRWGVLWRVLRKTGRLGVTGLVLGVVLTTLVAPAVRSKLYGVGTVDTLTYAVVSLLLLIIVGLASWAPARRAMATEPMAMLRDE